MPKSRKQKETDVQEYSDLLQRGRGAVFVNFSGLTVAQITQLRRSCQEKATKYVVIKKSLMKIVFDEAKLKENPKNFNGEIGTIIGFEDEITPAKIVAEFAKKNEAMKIIAGLLGTEFLNAESVLQLAKLPSKEQLLARFVGSIRAPLIGFVNVLQGNIRGLVQVLRQIEGKKST